MLHHVGIWPDGLVGELGQHLRGVFADALGIGLGAGVDPHVVLTGFPRRTMALGAANLREQLLAALYVGVAEVAGSRDGQSAMPHHELVVLTVAHLVLAVVGSTLEKIGVEGLLLGD